MKYPPIISIGFKFIVLLCFFFYLYSVQLRGMPFGTRVLLALFGFIVLFFKLVKEAEFRKDIMVSKKLVVFAFMFASIALISIVSLLFNGTRDLEFVKYPGSLVLILLAGYFLHFVLKKVHGKVTPQIILYYIILAVTIQVTLSLLSFLSAAVSDFLYNIQSFSDLYVSKLEETATFRLNGFGSTFFGAGIVNGFTLIGIASALKSKKISFWQILLLTVAFLLVFVLGMMMSRTTLIGFALAVVYLFIPSYMLNKKIVGNKLRFWFGMAVIPVAGVFLISIFSSKTMDMLESAADFGFEMFINYQETGEFSSKSTDVLQTMFVWPKNIKTYVIGDGKYYNVAGDPNQGYYMGTDVGYLRLIYYFGIAGSFVYFLLQFSALYSAVSLNRGNAELKRFLFFAFLLCLILNIKGFTDLFFLITLFCFPFPEEQTALA